MANITFYVPDQPPAKYSLDDLEEISIGRAPDCDVVLDHSSVSGQHAFIRKIGAGLHVLVDNGSTNGIYLEGEQVSEGPLGNGASFHIGQVPAEYEGDEAAPTASSDSDESAEMGSSGDGGYGAPIAAVAETSTRPSGFTDLSPIEKVEKKDNMATIAYVIGFASILVALGLVLMTVMMKVPA